MSTTIIKHSDVLERHNINASALEFPDLPLQILTGPQAQGDVLIVPCDRPNQQFAPVPKSGVTVVAGESSGGNAHILHSLDGDCSWAANPARGTDLVQGWLNVPPGGSATLIHTEEHGVKGIGEGVYEVRRAREFVGEWRRLAD